ncbi:hypothetical protein QVD17_37157 [Tagetes erecta]|uniref:Uncharacterized protein n=1 Tax=Tagetes erecta TaxID=13708 RepID=A0AAD8K003_TARER|nr:hypothetical protein QVD17_37157 [Tagetes erecta]
MIGPGAVSYQWWVFLLFLWLQGLGLKSIWVSVRFSFSSVAFLLLFRLLIAALQGVDNARVESKVTTSQTINPDPKLNGHKMEPTSEKVATKERQRKKQLPKMSKKTRMSWSIASKALTRIILFTKNSLCMLTMSGPRQVKCLLFL